MGTTELAVVGTRRRRGTWRQREDRDAGRVPRPAGHGQRGVGGRHHRRHRHRGGADRGGHERRRAGRPARSSSCKLINSFSGMMIGADRVMSEKVSGSRRARDRGMVTAELAVATLAALVIMLLLSWGIYLMVIQVRCIDTAAEVARQAARGDDAAVARARREAPAGARVQIARSDGLVRVDGQRGGETPRHETGRGAAAGPGRGRARAGESPDERPATVRRSGQRERAQRTSAERVDADDRGLRRRDDAGLHGDDHLRVRDRRAPGPIGGRSGGSQRGHHGRSGRRRLRCGSPQRSGAPRSDLVLRAGRRPDRLRRLGHRHRRRPWCTRPGLPRQVSATAHAGSEEVGGSRRCRVSRTGRADASSGGRAARGIGRPSSARSIGSPDPAVATSSPRVLGTAVAPRSWRCRRRDRSRSAGCRRSSGRRRPSAPVPLLAQVLQPRLEDLHEAHRDPVSPGAPARPGQRRPSARRPARTGLRVARRRRSVARRPAASRRRAVLLSSGRVDPHPAARMQAGQPFPHGHSSIRSRAAVSQASARSYAPAANPLPGGGRRPRSPRHRRPRSRSGRRRRSGRWPRWRAARRRSDAPGHGRRRRTGPGQLRPLGVPPHRTVAAPAVTVKIVAAVDSTRSGRPAAWCPRPDRSARPVAGTPSPCC